MTSKIKITDAMWAIGLFEGEGCISIKKPVGRYGSRVQLRLGSSDKDVVERFNSVVGTGWIHSAKTNTGKPFWVWTTGVRSEVHRILTIFRPWLGKRRKDKASEAISILQTSTLTQQNVESTHRV